MEPTTAAVVKGAVEAADKIPFTSIVKQMLGPAADELAEKFRDSIRVYRYGRQLKLLEKAEKMATDAGFTPKAVPIKLLFPLLEGASLEENEDLHTMWAALLANASNPETPDLVHPSFTKVMEKLSPHDAAILNRGFEGISELLLRIQEAQPDEPLAASLQRLSFNHWDHVSSVGNRIWTDEDAVSYSSLQSEFLIEKWYNAAGRAFNMTAKGYYFVIACQPPVSMK
jgi:hypothetical protein